jgi:hypothetical protein
VVEETSKTDPLAPQSAASHGFRRIKNAQRMVAELRDGDGIDPRIEHRDRHRLGSKQKVDRSAERLACQISRCAQTFLLNETLADLEVYRVCHSKGNHFIIELGPRDSSVQFCQLMMQNIANARLSILRTALAREIHRKKVPTLSLRVLPPSISLSNPHATSHCEASP